MPIDRKFVPAVLLVQAILSGLEIATFAHCIRWLLFADEGWERRKKINWTTTIVTIFVGAFSATTLALNVKEELLYLGGRVVDDLLSDIEDFLLVRILHQIWFGPTLSLFFRQSITLFGTILILDAVMVRAVFVCAVVG